MHAITHLHHPSVQIQSLTLPSFLSLTQPCLAIVQRQSIEFLAIPSARKDVQSPANQPAPLSCLAAVQINGRILSVTPFDVPSTSTAAPTQRLAVLTDHNDPRLIILQSTPLPATGQYSVTATYSSLLTDFVRRPAETCLGLWTAKANRKQATSQGGVILAHTHSATIKVIPAAKDDRGFVKSFDAKLPHPTVISIATLDPAPVPPFQPSFAVLSISSTPSNIPGLGTQCTPVLSFHQVDEEKRALVPLPWGPQRKVPPLTPGRRSSQASSSAGTSAAAPPASNPKGRGPQAMGKTLTLEQARAREVELAQSPLTQAHVPIPFADALGAHLLTPLPAIAGGGVLLWSETSILLVPPPLGLYSNPFQSSQQSPESSQSPGISSKAQGKRRKPSNDAESDSQPVLSTSPDSAILARSPSSQANEHGKRRRSSLKAPAPSSDATKIIRLSLPRPTQVLAAEVVKEPQAQGIHIDATDHNRAALNIIFATAAGWLSNLEVTLTRQDSRTPWSPRTMHATKIGTIPSPTGPAALTYLGEGFVHIASASADSAFIHLSATVPTADGGQDTEDVEMVSPPTSPIAIKSSPRARITSARLHTQKARAMAEPLPDLPQSTSVKLHTIQTTPNLGPTLDFVIDGDLNTPSAGAQARIVAACGTGTTGALAVVRNGVAVEDLGGIQVQDGPRRVWNVGLADGAGLVCAAAHGTSILRFDSKGITDVTDSVGARVALIRTLECGSLSHGVWAHVSDACVTIFPPTGTPHTWRPPATQERDNNTITAAHVADDQILLGVTGNMVILLTLSDQGEIVRQDRVKVDNEVSSIHFSHGIAAVGQWSSNTVRLLRVPTLTDVTPMSVDELSALPRSVLIHSFANQNEPYLLVGLSNGAVVTYALSLPGDDSLSQTIGLLDKKISTLGHQPVQLVPFFTTLGKAAVLATTSGDVPTVIWAEDRRVTYASLGRPCVTSAACLTMPGAEPSVALALHDRIELVSVGEIGRLDISKTDLGLDNPISIAGLEKDEFGHYRYFLVSTAPFRPDGNATREDRPSKLVVFESAGMRKICEVRMDAWERANCVSTAVLDGVEFVIVGTGYIKPEETEVLTGRVLGFTWKVDQYTGTRTEWDESELKLRFEKHVDGNVYAVAGIAGKVLAAINSSVVSLEVQRQGANSRPGMQIDEDEESMVGPTDDASPLTITIQSQWASAYMAISLSPIQAEPNRVVVGDALRSMSILRVDSETGVLTEMARDCDPSWNSACAVLDSEEQLFVGADINFNLYTTQRAVLSTETKRRLEAAEERRRERAAQGDENAAQALSSSNRPAKEEGESSKWSHVMERRGAWHYGDLINQFRVGSLVSKATMSALAVDGNSKSKEEDSDATAGSTTKAAATTLPIDPRLIFCTSSGGIGIISQLDAETSQLLSKVEGNLQVLYSGAYTEASTEMEATQASSAGVAPRPLKTTNAGSIPFEDWRSLRTDHRTSPPAGFLDGDLLLRFTKSLSATEKVRVLQGEMNGMTRIGVECRERIEELIDGLGRVC